MTPAAKRAAAGYLVQHHQVSIRHACTISGLARASYYRKPIDWELRDAPIRAALKVLVEQRSNRGFWQCRKQLRRQGEPWNHKHIYRVYTAMGLNLRRKAKRRLPKRERASLYVPPHPDQVWSADFMCDSLNCGKRFRLFNVMDDFNRELIHVEVDSSITSARLVSIFERIQAEHRLPQVLRTDNGPEFLGECFVRWASKNGMAIQYIQPGKPNQNAYIERLNRTMREELLDPSLFVRLQDVREAAWWWQLEYNEERCHDALQDMTPREYKEKTAGSSTSEVSLI